MDADAWINYAETGLLPVVVYEYLLDGSLADRRTISMAEIFLDILNKRMTRSEQTRVGEAMRRLGWRKKRIGSRARRRYIYVRRAAFDTCLTP
jgi:hypothetical protein